MSLFDLVHQTFSVRWRQVQGCPDYWVSDQGDLMSLRTGRPYIMAPYLHKSKYSPTKYLRAPLRTFVGAKPILTFVHVIVCEAFNGRAPMGKNLALHKNGNSLDNRACNLYWGDHRQNAEDFKRHKQAKNP